MKKKTKTKKVKGWAIINLYPGFPLEEPTIWGTGGVAVAPMQIFSSLRRAEFIMNLDEHAKEVDKETTAIIPVTIIYHLA